MKNKLIVFGIYWGALILFGFIGLVVSGCESLTTVPTQKLSNDVIYRRDMIITVNGVTREGVITMPMLDKNKVHIEAAGDLDLFAMYNCAGEWVKPKAWNVTTTVRSGLFGWGTKTIDMKRQVDFEYIPQGLERLGACPLMLEGRSKDGKDSWGFIDFQTDSFKLQGVITCNSAVRPFEGVEACQTRAGLYQQLKFDEDVFLSPDPGCELDKTDGREFTFKMPSGMCVYRIKAKESGKLGKLTLIGYSGILIRE